MSDKLLKSAVVIFNFICYSNLRTIVISHGCTFCKIWQVMSCHIVVTQQIASDYSSSIIYINSTIVLVMECECVRYMNLTVSSLLLDYINYTCNNWKKFSAFN